MALVEQHSPVPTVLIFPPIYQFSFYRQSKLAHRHVFLLLAGCSAPCDIFNMERNNKENTAVLQLTRPLYTLFYTFVLKTHTGEAEITDGSFLKGAFVLRAAQVPREPWVIGLLCDIPTWGWDYVWDGRFLIFVQHTDLAEVRTSTPSACITAARRCGKQEAKVK